MSKCTSEKLCTELESRCQTMRPGGIKGLVRQDSGVVTYSIGRSDKGLTLRFCPFCGFSFLSPKKLQTYNVDEYFKTCGGCEDE